ncbi:hypothetical protein MKZ49_12365 [Pseudoalteromonas shioyasakiensis]|uniref:hypothetical protein n=1 Tax=Pseudoalteromonas shioyasakiensis TaxID=1190813 RepID=UPI0024A78DC8|nr:hypothetical protein [Pseudoalteromonas shioyasakiensis]MDI4652790.1 hypothetical protein [Pseudoalteromonas shioyasakiensis]
MAVIVLKWLLREKAISYQLSAISYQLSAISYQLSAISYQLSAISYQLSAISYQNYVGRHLWWQVLILGFRC